MSDDESSVEESIVEDDREEGGEEEEEKGEEEEDGVDLETKLVLQKVSSKPVHPEPEEEKKLTKEETGKCLTMLGKTGNAIDYAYLKVEAINMGLTDISVIPTFKYLEFVDVSGNHLKTEALYTLANLKNLVFIKADGNMIQALVYPIMPLLQVLILSNNEIPTTVGMKQPMLESLNLNHNLIKLVEDMDPKILHLRNLELRGNALTTTLGICLPTLHTLYLADNLINRLEGLDALVNLQKLHLRSNRLKKLDGFSKSLEKLKYINIRNNLIENMKELKKLSVLPSLEALVVLENPFTTDFEEEYRVEILVYLPKIKRIDKDTVQQNEAEEAEERRAGEEAGEEGPEGEEGVEVEDDD